MSDPNLGLQSFTYADRAKDASSEKLIAGIVARLTTPHESLALLLITCTDCGIMQIGNLPYVFSKEVNKCRQIPPNVSPPA
jgi:hypothetical protein